VSFIEVGFSFENPPGPNRQVFARYDFGLPSLLSDAGPVQLQQSLRNRRYSPPPGVDAGRDRLSSYLYVSTSDGL